jgi:hypothetical protein
MRPPNPWRHWQVIAPLSTLPHWKREFDGWTRLNTIVYHDAGGRVRPSAVRYSVPRGCVHCALTLMLQPGREEIMKYEWYYYNDAGQIVRVVSCRVLSCPVVSCRVLSCPVVSCRVLSCRVLSCLVVSCSVVSCSRVSCRVVLLEALLRSMLRSLVMAWVSVWCTDHEESREVLGADNVLRDAAC